MAMSIHRKENRGRIREGNRIRLRSRIGSTPRRVALLDLHNDAIYPVIAELRNNLGYVYSAPAIGSIPTDWCSSVT